MGDVAEVVDVDMDLDLVDDCCVVYSRFIDDLRGKLANHPKHNDNVNQYGVWIRDHPLLPEQEAEQPKRWMHVNFTVGCKTRKTTLAIRDDNVYVIGFKNQSGKWYELGRQGKNMALISGSTFLGCDLTYGSLSRSLVGVNLGMNCAVNAVHNLSAYPEGAANPETTKRHLVCLILMISESARMIPHYNTVHDGWLDGASLDGRLVNYLHNWKNMSRAMIQGKYSPNLQAIGVNNIETGCKVVHLLLNSPHRPSSGGLVRSGEGGPGGGGGGGREGGRGPGPSPGRREQERAKLKRKEKNRKAAKKGTTQQHDEEEPRRKYAKQGPPRQQDEEEPPPMPTEQGTALLLYGEEEDDDDDDEEEEYSKDDYDDDGNDNDDDDGCCNDKQLVDLGQLLVEVFSVRASSGVVGTIAVFDGIRGQIIYSHDGQGDAPIDSQGNLQLTGPYKAISAGGRVAIKFSGIIATDASDQSSSVYRATLWDGYAEDAVHDKVTTQSITTGTSQNAEVTYAVLSNAVETTVQVQLKLKSVKADSARLHGQITAQHFGCESILFNRNVGEEVELFPSSHGLIIPIPLDRCVVAASLNSSLALNVKLHAACPPNHENIVFEDNLVFSIEEHTSRKEIEGPGAVVQVTITSPDINPPREQDDVWDLQGEGKAAPDGELSQQHSTVVTWGATQYIPPPLERTLASQQSPPICRRKSTLSEGEQSTVTEEREQSTLSEGVQSTLTEEGVQSLKISVLEAEKGGKSKAPDGLQGRSEEEEAPPRRSKRRWAPSQRYAGPDWTT